MIDHSYQSNHCVWDTESREENVRGNISGYFQWAQSRLRISQSLAGCESNRWSASAPYVYSLPLSHLADTRRITGTGAQAILPFPPITFCSKYYKLQRKVRLEITSIRTAREIMAEVKYVERDNETSVSLLTANWSAQIKPKILNTRTEREKICRNFLMSL